MGEKKEHHTVSGACSDCRWSSPPLSNQSSDQGSYPSDRSAGQPMECSAEETHFWTGKSRSSFGIHSDTKDKYTNIQRLQCLVALHKSNPRNSILSSSEDPNISKYIYTKCVIVYFRQAKLNRAICEEIVDVNAGCGRADVKLILLALMPIMFERCGIL